MFANYRQQKGDLLFLFNYFKTRKYVVIQKVRGLKGDQHYSQFNLKSLATFP